MMGYTSGLCSGLYLATVLLLGIPRYHFTVNVGHSLTGSVYACRMVEASDVFRQGDVVYYLPPPRVQEVIRTMAPHVDLRLGWLKQVAATGGDTVCWEGGYLLVNQEIRGELSLLHDYPLTVPNTCQVLGQKEVLTLGVAPRSFDGRYTGPLRREEVTDVCTVLF